MTPRELVDGRDADVLPLSDRGLAYGDGVFETILLHEGRAVWWQAHLERLRRGARALGIAPPGDDTWQADLQQVRQSAPSRAVLKLVLTRGDGARGYAADRDAAPRRITRLLAAPALEPAHARDGVHVRWCSLRLADQPRLAGIKHLNRLEQVLARAEWSDPEITDGLLCAADGRVVSATAANLFIVRDGALLTPPVTRCGVAGVCRQMLMSLAAVRESELGVDDVQAADELFLCNSVRGILPVCRLDRFAWRVGPVTRSLMARLASVEPAFAVESA